jgi:hypothetical protein
MARSSDTTSEAGPDKSVVSQDATPMAVNNRADRLVGERESVTENLTRGGSDNSNLKGPEALTGADPATNNDGTDQVVADTALDTSNQVDSASATPEITEIAASPEGDTVAVDGDGQVVEDAVLAASDLAADDVAPVDTGKSIARYFPLDDDRRWEYRVRVMHAGKDLPEATATKSVKGKREISGKQYVRVATEFARRVPDQYYRLDDRGVYAAVQGTPGEELLILPAEAETIGSWSGTAKPVFTKFSGSATVDETYRCGDQVFEDCIKVTLTMILVEKNLFSQREVPVRFDRWFAPGVGMVAEVREVGDSDKLEQRWVSELIRAKP